MKSLIIEIVCLLIMLSSTFAQSATLQSVRYEVLAVGCTKDSACLAIVYLDARFFNERDMKEVAKRLSLQFKEKTVINANIFDDKELATAHATSSVEPQEFQHNRRGWYARYENQEVLLFRPDNRKRSMFIRINLKEKLSEINLNFTLYTAPSNNSLEWTRKEQAFHARLSWYWWAVRAI